MPIAAAAIALIANRKAVAAAARAAAPYGYGPAVASLPPSTVRLAPVT
jgi:hypothetical protein